MDLTPLMKPKSVAVVGASTRMNRATRVIANLQRFGYGGRIFPINPRYTEIHGLPCYPDLASTPEPADTVVVAIPAEQVPAVLTAAVDRGVRGAVVLSSGFGEAGPAGQARQATFCFGSHAAGDLDQDVVAPLAEAGVPYLEATETAMQALRHARDYHRFLARPAPALAPPARDAASTPTARGVLANAEAMRLLREFGIPLADALVGLAALAQAHRDRLRALDLNPLVVLDEGRGVVAVDWLIELA